MTLSPNMQKLFVGAVLYAAYGALVFMGKVPAADFVETTKLGLEGLGLYHVTKSASQS